MPRKTMSLVSRTSFSIWCFNEAAARCHGKLVQVPDEVPG